MVEPPRTSFIFNWCTEPGPPLRPPTARKIAKKISPPTRNGTLHRTSGTGFRSPCLYRMFPFVLSTYSTQRSLASSSCQSRCREGGGQPEAQRRTAKRCYRRVGTLVSNTTREVIPVPNHDCIFRGRNGAIHPQRMHQFGREG